jgi:5-methyltetrahydrofolate--homocysteine methyltransferase
MMDKEAIYQRLSTGDVEQVKKWVEESLATGESPNVIMKEGLIVAMERFGVLFKNGEVFIPEVLLAARAMHAGMAVLKPILVKHGGTAAQKIVIGTVKGDLHDIGKNLVIMMLEGAGFEVVDLGMNVSYEKFAEAIRVHRPAVVGMCALLTTTMTEMKKTIQYLGQAGLREEIKIIVGGAPVTEKFALDIGADGYGKDASDAVELVRRLAPQGSD